MKYDAFVSYSHAEDRDLAASLQASLSRFAKPWYRPRALRIFRDATSLSANPGLWNAIEAALNESRCFILFASPLSANSGWVQREVQWWLDNRSADDLYIVLTNGTLQWSDKQRDFDWSVTDSVPGLLSGIFSEEPLYVDLSWARSTDEQSIRHSRFRGAVLDLAAPLRGIPKDDLDSEEIRQNRRVRVLTASAIALLVLLAIGATVAALIAYYQRQIAVTERIRADRQRDLAVASELAAQASLADTKERPERALLLAAEAAEAYSPVEPGPEQVLRNLLSTIGGLPFPPPSPAPVSSQNPDLRPAEETDVRPDGQRPRRIHKARADRWLLTDADGDHLALWDLTHIGPNWQPTRLKTVEKVHRIHATFSPDGNWLVVAGNRFSDKPGVLFDLTAATAGIRQFEIAGNISIVRFSNNGRRLLLASNRGPWQVYDLDRETEPVIRSLPQPTKSPSGHSARFSPDSRWLISWGQAIYIWDLEASGGEPAVIEKTRARRIEFTPDSTAFIAVGSGSVPSLFALPPEPQKRQVLARKGTSDVLVSPDGKWLFAKPNLWRLKGGGVSGPPIELDIGPKERSGIPRWRFLSGGGWLVRETERLRLWRLAMPVTSTPGFDIASKFEIGSDDRWLLVRPRNEPARLIDLRTTESVELPGPPVIAASFSPDGGSVVVVDKDGDVVDTSLSAPESSRRIARVTSGKTIRHSPGGGWVLVDNVLISKDRSDFKPMTIELKGHRDAKFMNDDWLVVRHGGSVLHRYDLRTDTLSVSRDVLRGHEQYISFLRFLGDSSRLLTASRIRDDLVQARLWDLQRPSNAAFPKLLRCENGSALDGRFGPRGRWFAAHCQGRSIAIWPLVGDGSPIVTYQAEKNLTGAPRFDHSGQWAAVLGTGGDSYLIDLRNDTKLVRRVECADPQFSPDGRWVAMSRRGESCIRKLDGVEEVRVEKTEGYMVSQVFAADGNLIVVRRGKSTGERLGQSFVAYRYRLGENPARSEELLSSPEKPEVDVTGRWLTSGDGQVVNLLDGRRFKLRTVPHPATYRKVHEDHDSKVRIEVSPDGRWAVPVRWIREGFPEMNPRFYYTWQDLFELEAGDPAHPVFSLSRPQDVKFAGFAAGESGWVVVDTGNMAHRLSYNSKGYPRSLIALGQIEGEGFELSPAGSWLISTGEDRVFLTPIDEGRVVSASLPNFKPPALGAFKYRFSADDAVLANTTGRTGQFWRTSLPADRRWPVELAERILDISADGQWLATTHRAGVALHPVSVEALVKAARSTAGRRLTQIEATEFLRR